MACDQFVEGRLCRCSAVRGLLIPSIYERERFCRTEEGFSRCPTYRAFNARRAKLPQEVYYALWMPLMEEPAVTEEERSAESVEQTAPVV